MKYTQKIMCNVANCAHNCIEDSTCRLDKITIANCGHKTTGNASTDTLCSNFLNIGNLNVEEKSGIST